MKMNYRLGLWRGASEDLNLPNISPLMYAFPLRGLYSLLMQLVISTLRETHPLITPMLIFLPPP